MVKQRT